MFGVYIAPALELCWWIALCTSFVSHQLGLEEYGSKNLLSLDAWLTL